MFRRVTLLKSTVIIVAITASLVLCDSLTIAAQTPQIVWSKRYGRPGQDNLVRLVAASPNGYFLLTNSDFGEPRYSDPNLYRIDSLGDTLWSRSLDMINVGGRAVASMPDGGCVIVASIPDFADTSYEEDILIVRYAASGDTLWTRRFGGPGWQAAIGVCANDKGEIVIAGGSTGYGFGDAWTLVQKISAIGDSLWATKLDFGYNGWGSNANCIAGLPNGDYVIAGNGAFVDDAAVPFVARLDSEGHLRFSRRYWMVNANPICLTVSPDGDFAIAGQYNGEYGDFRAPWLLRGQATGDSLWSYVDSTKVGLFSSAVMLSDNSVLSYGPTSRTGTGVSLVTLFNRRGIITMQFNYQYFGHSTHGQGLLVGDLSHDSTVTLYGGISDPLSPPCPYCELFVTKLDSLPIRLCCDIDGDGLGPNVGDVLALIDYLYVSLSPLCCPPEANVDEEPGTDMSDLSALIDYLYISFRPPAACQ